MYSFSCIINTLTTKKVVKICGQNRVNPPQQKSWLRLWFTRN